MGRPLTPVIVQVHGISNPASLGHYVLVTGKTGNTYSIIDPGCSQASDLSSAFSCPSVADPTRTVSYGNSYVIVGTVKDPPDRSEVDVSIPGNAALQVVDPNGLQTAFDPATFQTSNQIPNSAYSLYALDDDEEVSPLIGPAHYVQIPTPMQGISRVVVRGLATGNFALNISAYDRLGQNEGPLSFSGSAQPGSTATFLVTVSTTPGSAGSVSSLPGDRNGDGVVDCSDLAIVKASFGKKSGQAGFDPRADVNGDGVVNLVDLATVSRQLPAGTKCQ